MRERRALMIAGVFPPAGGAGAVRLAKLATHLGPQGWRVDVIAPQEGGGWYQDPELARSVESLTVGRVQAWVRFPDRVRRWREATKDAAMHVSEGSPLALLGRGARSVRDALAIPDEHLAWAYSAWRSARRALQRAPYDLVLTSSSPYSAHLVGWALRRSGGPAWLAELRDPWVGHVFRDSALRRHVAPKLERLVVRGAEEVTVASPDIARQLERRYGGEHQWL